MDITQIAWRLAEHMPQHHRLIHGAALEIISMALRGHPHNEASSNENSSGSPQIDLGQPLRNEQVERALSHAKGMEYLSSKGHPFELALQHALQQLHQPSPLEQLEQGRFSWPGDLRSAREATADWKSCNADSPWHPGSQLLEDPDTVTRITRAAMRKSMTPAMKRGMLHLSTLGAPAWIRDGRIPAWPPHLPLGARLSIASLRELTGQSLEAGEHPRTSDLRRLPLAECCAWGEVAGSEIEAQLLKHIKAGHGLELQGQRLEFSSGVLAGSSLELDLIDLTTLSLLIIQHSGEQPTPASTLLGRLIEVFPTLRRTDRHEATRRLSSSGLAEALSEVARTAGLDLGWLSDRVPVAWSLTRNQEILEGVKVSSMAEQPARREMREAVPTQQGSSVHPKVSKAEIARVRAWIGSGNDEVRHLAHALRLTFRIDRKARIKVGMEGDTKRLRSMEGSTPGIWRGLEQVLIGGWYVRRQNKAPAVDGSNPVRLDQHGYRILRMDGNPSGDEVQERTFQRKTRLNGKVWYEKGETNAETERRHQREAAEARAALPPIGHVPKGAKIAKTTNGRRAHNLLRLFVADRHGVIHAQNGPTDRQAHSLMSHAMLSELIGKHYLHVDGPRGTGKVKLSRKGIQLLRSCNIKVQG